MQNNLWKWLLMLFMNWENLYVLLVGVKYCSTLLFYKFTKLFFPCFLTHLWMITVRKSKYDQLGTSRLFCCFLGLLISALKVRQESLEREREWRRAAVFGLVASGCSVNLWANQVFSWWKVWIAGRSVQKMFILSL